MADLVDHVAQAKHNLACASKFLTDAQCRDWAITAAFYAAVHFAEAGFTANEVGHSDAKRPQNEEPHSYRERMVREKFGEECYRSYRKLRTASNNVRYLADWSARPGMSLDYYPQSAAERFINVDLSLVRQKIQQMAGVNLG
jgi:hypothetical protein